MQALEEQFGGEDDSLSGPRPMQTDTLQQQPTGDNNTNATPTVAPAGAGGAGAGPAPAAATGTPTQPLVAPKRLGGGGGLKFTRFSNAYMLVYVRVCDWDRIMVPVTKDDIAPYLRERLEVRRGGL